jgi:WD40 repeat protein
MLVATVDGSRFISASLDNEINIWKINYKANSNKSKIPIFDSCYLEKKFKTTSFVCSLNTICSNQLICCLKEGKICIIDIDTSKILNEI